MTSNKTIGFLVGAAFLASLWYTHGRSIASPSRASFDLAGATVVDLSHAYDRDTVYWPTAPSKFEHRFDFRGMTDGGYWYESASLSTPEHGGTHLDAPVHFAKGKWSNDALPVERLVAPAVVVDVSEQAGVDADYRVSLDDVAAFEKEHGRIPSGAIVLMRSGWFARWPDRKRYMGDDTPGDASDLHFPGFGAEAVRWLIAERSIHALGVDTASIDHGPSTDFIVHRIAGEANVFGLENLANLDELPATGAWVAALPMKIADGTGGPVRVVGFVQAGLSDAM